MYVSVYVCTWMLCYVCHPRAQKHEAKRATLSIELSRLLESKFVDVLFFLWWYSHSWQVCHFTLVCTRKSTNDVDRDAFQRRGQKRVLKRCVIKKALTSKSLQWGMPYEQGINQQERAPKHHTTVFARPRVRSNRWRLKRACTKSVCVYVYVCVCICMYMNVMLCMSPSRSKTWGKKGHP